MRCLFSVLTAETSVPFKLLVIDDASPVATLSETLEALSARGLFELLVNSHNLGFVASVNQVLGLLDDVDVLLLNSDAEVFPGWLDRLYATLRRIPLAASVTPLTNNGTIASYPLWPAGSNIELELGPAELDNIAATSLAGQALEIPTCVGSCALLRRAAIKDVGVFDEGAFGRGYGEENDWSRKATEKGWVNLLALDTFVSHRGGVSFGPEASQRRRAGLRALETLHPGYEQSVREFIEADPLAKIRRTLDLARLQRARDGRPTVMLVSHRHGGGTNRHVQDLARRLDEAGMFAVLTEPNKGRLRLTSPLVPVTPNLAFGWNIAVPDSDLVEALRALDVRLIHVNHLQGYGARAPAGIRSLAQALAIPFDVTLHDWMAVCPRIDMIDGSGRYCGGPGASKCQTCIDRNGSQFGRVDMTSWRESYFGLLRAARRVIVPSRDSHDRWAALLPDVTFHMQPHPEEARQFTPDMRVRSDGPAHVALIGAINVGKGSQVLLKLVRDADARALPIRFHVIGHTDCDGMLSKYSRIDITGPYTSIELSSLVEESGSDVALFLSLTPETFSYTLSEALNMGLHPVAFDFGAIAGRMREEQVGTLVPMCMVDDPNDINDLLVSIIPEVPKPQTTTRYENFLKDYYDLPPL
jgi:GT2 family glycosyltransferase/glycosyltransferase involved in cell wall biosynthesis